MNLKNKKNINNKIVYTNWVHYKTLDLRQKKISFTPRKGFNTQQANIIKTDANRIFVSLYYHKNRDKTFLNDADFISRVSSNPWFPSICNLKYVYEYRLKTTKKDYFLRKEDIYTPSCIGQQNNSLRVKGKKIRFLKCQRHLLVIFKANGRHF